MMDSKPVLICVSNKPWIKKMISRSKINAGIVNKAATLTRYHFKCAIFEIFNMVYGVVKSKQVALISWKQKNAILLKN